MVSALTSSRIQADDAPDLRADLADSRTTTGATAALPWLARREAASYLVKALLGSPAR